MAVTIRQEVHRLFDEFRRATIFRWSSCNVRVLRHCGCAVPFKFDVIRKVAGKRLLYEIAISEYVAAVQK